MKYKNLALRVSSVILIATVPASTVSAQLASVAGDTAKSKASQEPLFVRRDAFVAAAFTGITIAMFPLDKSVARRLTNERSKANQFFNKSSTAVEFIADPGSIIIGSALYLYGRMSHHPDIEDLGWHGTEAVILGSSITFALKGLAGRERPFAAGDTNVHDFKFAKGFTDSNRQSFPSGHTTAAFAAASAVTSEAQRIWPGHDVLVGGVMYGGATLVGLSRMYHDKHWASDVALGAAIGTFSGLKVVRYAHTHPDNRLDHIILRTALGPGPTGRQLQVGLAFSP